LEEQPELTADEARRQLEVEVSSLKRELAELRKELAAKVSWERVNSQPGHNNSQS
jgi:hypothetical protein